MSYIPESTNSVIFLILQDTWSSFISSNFFVPNSSTVNDAITDP